MLHSRAPQSGSAGRLEEGWGTCSGVGLAARRQDQGQIPQRGVAQTRDREREGCRPQFATKLAVGVPQSRHRRSAVQGLIAGCSEHGAQGILRPPQARPRGLGHSRPRRARRRGASPGSALVAAHGSGRGRGLRRIIALGSAGGAAEGRLGRGRAWSARAMATKWRADGRGNPGGTLRLAVCRGLGRRHWESSIGRLPCLIPRRGPPMALLAKAC
mmetsp:Transcript_10979/g.27516  ORF Transcript_10979/g.27516 Transcript_10979/m.27516 type:complete len:215 (-) Transcript_10979:14-658(-)